MFVIHGTTITYTTLSSPLTTVIDGEDTIVLDPSAGVIITRNHPGAAAPGSGAPAAAAATVTTLGGPLADPSATEFAVVGGATITKVGASVVIVEGVTYTVGPGATAAFTGTGTGTGANSSGEKVTTVLSGSGQTVTIGPEGVVVGTMTIEYPLNGDGGDGGSSTTVIFPGGGPGSAETATATAGSRGGGGDGAAKGGEDDEDAGVEMKVMWTVMMLGLGVAGAVGVFGL